MNQILIADHATYAAKQGGGVVADIREAGLLVDGAMAIFTETGVLVTAATVVASIANVKQFIVCANSTLNGLWKSIPIDRDAFFRSYCAYVAPVKQVRAVGYNGTTGGVNLPVALVVGETAELAVGVYDPSRAPNMQWIRASYTVRNGDTDVNVINGLIASFNAQPNRPALAAVILNAGTPEGIRFTALNDDEPLIIRVSDLLEAADISTITEVTYGKGTPAQVREAEMTSWLEDGDDNRRHLAAEYWKIASDVDVTQYDLFSIQWATEALNAIGVSGVAAPRITLAIGNATLRASINTILTTKVYTSIPNTGAGSSASGL